MEQINTQENTAQESKKKNTFLAAAVIILVIALAAQTFYLFKIKAEADKLRAWQELALSRQRQLQTASPAAGGGAAVFPVMGGARAMDRWDPFMEMERMQERMNRLFHESFRRASFMSDEPAMPAAGALPSFFFEPDADIEDQGDRYLIKLDLPGMEKDKIDLSVTEHAITVSGERKIEEQTSDERTGFYSMERRFGSFTRSIPLPGDADPGQVKANYDKGVLTIELKKKAQGGAGAAAKKVSVE